MRRRTRLTLIAAFCLGIGPGSSAGVPADAQFVGAYLWAGDDARFGGFSALHVAADGNGFTALTDRAAVVTGRFLRDGGGVITGIDADPLLELRGRSDTTLPPARTDSEGIAMAADGTIFVSFELAARVLRFASLADAPEYLPIPREFNRMGGNTALESLAIDTNGTLYTLPESPRRRDGAFPVYRFRNGTWDQPFVVPGRGGFVPVGADVGPDGRFYLLEREVRGLHGFATRVRRFALSDSALTDEETVLEPPAGRFHNLEGLSLWRDTGGDLRLTMISDDNFRSFLRTEIVEYRIDG